MKYILFLIIACSCYRANPNTEPLTLIQIQDRNGITETISTPEKLAAYNDVDFLSSQPYKKVVRMYRVEGSNKLKLSSYHSNGTIYQYLEGEAMRARGAYLQWHPNGQMKVKAQVISGTADLAEGSQQDWLFEGKNEVWNEHGDLVAQISYSRGDLEGPSTYFFPSGQIEKKLLFKGNVLNGECLEYFPSGQLKSKIEYQKGCKHGKGAIYFEDGKQVADEFYREGLLLKGTYHDPDGEIVSEVNNGGGFQASFEDGALTLIEFKMGRQDGLVKQLSKSKELTRTLTIKNGKKQGEEIDYYLSHEVDGKVDAPRAKLSVHWNENMLHGSVKTWYPNGQLQSQREFSRNQKTGPALAWYKNGALMMVEEYEQDVLTKGQYFKVNRHEPISTIAAGNGLATFYDEEGVFLRKVTYAKGKPVEP